MFTFRSLIRNGFSLAILASALVAILGPSPSLAQQPQRFGTPDVPCPTTIPAPAGTGVGLNAGKNIICNGSINFLTTELFFEPETPPQTLKGAPTTWNELEQLLDNPYLYTWGADCNDFQGTVPGTENGFPTYCTPKTDIPGEVGGTFFRRPTTADANGLYLASTLPPLLVHPLNLNPQTGFGAQMRILNPEYAGTQNFQVSGTVFDIFSFPTFRSATGVCYGVGASCTPATQTMNITSGASRLGPVGTADDPGETVIDMNVATGRQSSFCQTNPEPIPITGTYNLNSTQFDSENLTTCGADVGEPGAASLAHRNTALALCATQVAGAGSLAGYLCEDNMGLPIVGASTSSWYSLPAVRAPSALAAMMMQRPNGGLTTPTVNGVAYTGTGVIINPRAPDPLTAPIGGFRLSDPARGGVILPLDVATGVGGMHKPSLRKAEVGGNGTDPNYLWNSATAVSTDRPDPTGADLQPSNENDYVGLFGAGSLGQQKQQARLEAMTLGKSLFWDQQVGSDGVQACGSCHAHAAADNRTKNQINPNGQDGIAGAPTNFPFNQFEHAVNTDLKASDFPFVKLRDPEISADPLCVPAIRANVIGFTFPDGDPLDHPKFNRLNIGVGRPPDNRLCDATNRIAPDSDDVASSMGVHFGLFGDIPAGTGTGLTNDPGPNSPFGPASHGVRALVRDQRSSTALGASLAQVVIDNTDPIAGFMGSAVEADGSLHQFRRVEPRNTPTIDLADMNFDNFWDGRARHDDNGGSVFGASDPQAHVFATTNAANSPDGDLTATRQLIKFSSLGALAKGPALSKFEMSFDGRNWPKIGKRLLQAGVTPLANQLVDPTDSILGRYSNQNGSACAALPDSDRSPEGGPPTTLGVGVPGLCISYPALIRHAFYAGLWQNTSNHLDGCYTDKRADIHPNQCVGLPPITVLDHPSPGVDVLNDTTNTADPFDQYRLAPAAGAASASNTNQFTQMEGNFSLFWGQSLHLWATILVPDDTPDDQFLDKNPDVGASMGETGEPLLVLDVPSCTNTPADYHRGYYIGADGFLQYRAGCFTEVGNFKRDRDPGPIVFTQNDTVGHRRMTACIAETTIAGIRTCTQRVAATGTRNPGDPDPLLGFDIFFGSNASLKNPNFRSGRCGACHNAPALTDNTSPFTVKAQELDNFAEFERSNPTVEPLTEPPIRERVISGFLLESEINEPGQDAIERKAGNLSLVPAPVVANNGNCITDNCSGYVFPDGITAHKGPDGTYSQATVVNGQGWVMHRDIAGGPVAGPGVPVPFTGYGGTFLDNGVYNIGVRPCVADESKVTGACEDVGRGGTDAFGWPLSLSALMLKNFGGPGQQPGVAIAAFNPSAAPTRGDELVCAPYCSTGGLLQLTAQDQHINPGYEDEVANPAVPGYLAPFLNRIPVGDEHPQSDEGCGPVGGCINTLMDVANEEGFPEMPFNPRATNVEVTNGAIASGDADVGLTGRGCNIAGGSAPCTAGTTASGPMRFKGSAEMGTWPVVNRVNRFGSFKAPQLREVELTGPYFHNGGKLTLRQVVDFYVRGGDFPVTNSNHRDFNILNLNAELQSDLSEEEKVALVDYMLEFTDDRLAREAAPFDHPQMILPLDGTAPESDGTFALQEVTTANCADSAIGPGAQACSGNLATPAGATGPLFLSVPATGAAGIPVGTRGGTRIPNFLGIAGAAADELNPLGRKRLVGLAAFCGANINSQYCH